MMQKASNEELL